VTQGWELARKQRAIFIEFAVADAIANPARASTVRCELRTAAPSLPLRSA
jgi:hypothetical protein